MNIKLTVFLVVSTLLAMLAQSIFFTVKESERGIKLRFGEVIQTDIQPGLHWKLPVVHEINLFEVRNQVFDMPPQVYYSLYEGAPVRIDVDSYVIWRITNVKKYLTDTSGSMSKALGLLESLVGSGLRDKFGELTLPEVVSSKRAELAKLLTDEINQKTETELGIQILDIKVKKVELPIEVSESVFANMRAERERKAREERAFGKKKAEGIRASADRSVTVLLAEAYERSEKIRGQGDAEAATIYADAYGRDPEFYDFTRSLNAYLFAFQGKNNVLLLSPNSDFFKHLLHKKP